jgi:hypothetical protein
LFGTVDQILIFGIELYKFWLHAAMIYCHVISTGGALVWFLAAYLAYHVFAPMFLSYIT